MSSPKKPTTPSKSRSSSSNKISKPLRVHQIPLNHLDPPTAQVRLEINPDHIKNLADSIAARGLQSPITVRPTGARYEVVWGHRRTLAVKQLGWTHIPAFIKELDDTATLLDRATENLAREDLSPIEEAAVYKELQDTMNLTYDKIAQLMGRSPGTIQRRLDLLKMPPPLQQAIHKKQIPYSVAEELWSIHDAAALDYYLQYAIDHGITQAVARQWVHDWKDKQARAALGDAMSLPPETPIGPRIHYLACDICDAPTELGKEQILRVCDHCAAQIKQALRQPQT